MKLIVSILHRRWIALLAVVACLVITPRTAHAAALEVVYPDGQRDYPEVPIYDGVEYVSRKTLERLLLKVDAGVRINATYDELRIIVLGKSITIMRDQEHMVVDGRILRPQSTLKSVEGDLYVPVETLEEINSALNLVELRRPSALTPTPFVTPTPLPPPTQPYADPTTQPDSLIMPPPDAPETTLPAIEALPTPPLEIAQGPNPQTGIAPAVMNSLLGQANVPQLARIAIVPFVADRKTYGKHAEQVSLIATQAAQRLRQVLEESGQFEVAMPPQQVWSAQTLEKAINWANGAHCDALLALTVDSTSSTREQGVRLMVSHQASDASARDTTLMSSRGLPQRWNYIPYEKKSTEMAKLLHEELSKARSIAVNPVEVAPLYFLRRVSMPSVEISLGNVGSQVERERMSHGEFNEEICRGVMAALVRMQKSVQEQLP